MSVKKVKKRIYLSRAWQARLAAALVLAAIVFGIATYAALTETPPLGNDPDTVIWLLNVDFIVLLLLVGIIARRIVSLWSGRKRGLAGSHLHVRLVYTFSVLAAAPAIIMTVFSAFFFHFGIQTWFSQRVQTAVNESQAVAEAYLEEHRQVIRADTLAMANDLDRQAPYLIMNEKAFEKIIQTQSIFRNLSEAIVFEASGHVLARSGLTFSLEFEEVPPYAMREANDGEVAVMTGGNDDSVRALVKLNSLTDTYLFVGRMVDPQVLSHVTATRQASQDYEALQSRYAGLQVTVTMIFVVVGLLLMLAAIWFGLMLARQLVRPISVLIRTADRVRAGDLTARVPDDQKLREFQYLAQSFNRMTKQIQEQQTELLNANRQLDHRRQFTETVLEGVSSGVIGVNTKGKINLANSSAMKLLGLEDSAVTGKKIAEILPGIAEMLDAAHAKPQNVTQGEIQLQRDGQGKKTFLIRIAIELIDQKDTGAIITFDDITALQSAQRKAAWSDVARRIAHEIKNPLTPIQLSAERLRRKYLSQILDDPETFSQCTETIIKNVSDIGRMVDEFSSFARMPEPVMKYDDLATHIDETLALHRNAHPGIGIGFKTAGRRRKIRAWFDGPQVRQVLNNVIQNSVDSIRASGGESAGAGAIDIVLFVNDMEEAVLSVTDSGPGFPLDSDPALLTEPYVTHKPKGTGLGLAIVKKIMEDHGGRIVINPPEDFIPKTCRSNLEGARLALVFPMDKKERNTVTKAAAAA